MTSRYDDLRRMREAKFARTRATTPAEPVTKPVTKIDANSVTKIESVTKSDAVTKKRKGRPPLGDKPMTPAERMRRYRTFNWRKRDEFGRRSAHCLGSVGPPIVDEDVLASNPTQLLKSLHERGEASLSFRIAFRKWAQDTDAAHPLGLLRPGRERPSRSAPEQRDELAASHSITSLGRGRTSWWCVSWARAATTLLAVTASKASPPAAR